MNERLIGNYKVIKSLGAGGEAEVFLAQHKDISNLRGVLKLLRDPRQADRFKQQADKLGLLETDPRICKIKDYFEWQGDYVILMEVIDGITLDDDIKARGKIPMDEAVRIAVEILDVLDVAHSRGISHRDIKPSNIMITQDSRQIKVIDFGIAKSESDPSLTAVGGCCGTPDYMAPEQFSSGEESDLPRLDIYATGVTLFRMLTGRLPFAGKDLFEIRDAKLFSEPQRPRVLNPDIPEWLEEIVLTAIDKDPNRRFASAGHMRDALTSHEKTIIPASDRPHKPRRQKSRRKSGKAPLLIGVAIVIVAIAVAVWMWLPSAEVARPDLISPPSAESFEQGQAISMCWHRVSGSNISYRLDIAGDPAFQNVIAPIGPLVDTCFLLPSERFDTGTFHWRVGAVATDNPNSVLGSYSEARVFSLMPSQAEVDTQPTPVVQIDEEPSQRDRQIRDSDQDIAQPALCSLAVASRPVRAEVVIDNAIQQFTTPHIFILPRGQHKLIVRNETDTLERTINLENSYLRAKFELEDKTVTIDRQR
jgi:serine/threonine protein kinase